MTFPFYDENLYILNMKNDIENKASEATPTIECLIAATKDPIPPSSVLRQLAVAVEDGRRSRSVKDFTVSSANSSPAGDKGGLSLQVVKALVLGEKEDKLPADFSKDEKIGFLINSLFDREGEFLKRKISSSSEENSIASLARDIHGAPPESIVVKLAEIIGNFRSLRKMALFWCTVVVELKKLWSEEQHIPGVPLDEIPDLKSCLLYQQFQVINCCISRKRRRFTATESLDSLMEGSSVTKESMRDHIPKAPVLYARLNTGELVLRLGADRPSGDLTLLETGEPVYSPVMQEGPLLTEDLIKETEEFVLRTGSVGAGCSQLLSDMQAFKAANPGCILEDFVRWHSPPDWSECEQDAEAKDSSDGGDSAESLSTRGQLSQRMQKEGNLWRELWATSKPVPAVKQTPLFDEDLAVEGILRAFEDIQPSELFRQLFVSLLGLGVAIAEPLLSGSSDFSKLFCDCKEYVVVTCQSGSWMERIDELCQVYQTVETMLTNPEEALMMIKEADESAKTSGELKRRFKRLSFIFSGKDKPWRKPASEDSVGSEDNPIRQSFSSFFDGKSSVFLKKSFKFNDISPRGKSPSPDNNQTVVSAKLS
ncbi:rab3 GTPase-activating protein catalytic subunit isoform X2 [Neltuma alba]|nr:rab3 GTPase-activating protein catalytic subunit-like isoform X2 [Prosopis alba]